MTKQKTSTNLEWNIVSRMIHLAYCYKKREKLEFLSVLHKKLLHVSTDLTIESKTVLQKKKTDHESNTKEKMTSLNHETQLVLSLSWYKKY